MSISSARREVARVDGERRLVDIEGAAEYLTVSVRYVRTLLADRRLPYLKVGKYVRFDLDELDAWLESCRVGTGA